MLQQILLQRIMQSNKIRKNMNFEELDLALIRIRDDLALAIRIQKLFTQSATKKDVVGTLNKKIANSGSTHAGQSLTIVWDSLHIYLITVLFRVLDKDDNSQSLYKVFRLIKNNFDSAVMQINKIHPAIDASQKIKELKESFDKITGAVETAKLKRLRNEIIAHKTETPLRDIDAKVGYERKLLEKLCTIVEEMLELFSGEIVVYITDRYRAEIAADKFWYCLGDQPDPHPHLKVSNCLPPAGYN